MVQLLIILINEFASVCFGLVSFRKIYYIENPLIEENEQPSMEKHPMYFILYYITFT